VIKETLLRSDKVERYLNMYQQWYTVMVRTRNTRIIDTSIPIVL